MCLPSCWAGQPVSRAPPVSPHTQVPLPLQGLIAEWTEARADPPRTVSAASPRGSLRAFTQAPLTSTDGRVRALTLPTRHPYSWTPATRSAFCSHTPTSSQKSLHSPQQSLPPISFLQMTARTNPKQLRPELKTTPRISAFGKRHILYAQGYTLSPKYARTSTCTDLASSYFLREAFLKSTLSALVTPSVGRRSQL